MPKIVLESAFLSLSFFMKIFIQAKPQLRGPRGLREWYAQLPVASGGEGEPADILPIGGLLAPPRPAALLSGTGTVRLAWFKRRPFKVLLSMLSKKSCLEESRQTFATNDSVWLRHLIGVMVLVGSIKP